MRVEDLNFSERLVWIPFGKTAKARRFVPMSERMADVIAVRCTGRKDGWLFPSARSKSGHIETIAKGFQSLRARTGVSQKVVPYSARHTYGSFAMAATGNLFAVADSMGHVDTRSMAPYQHHDLSSLRQAINQRNRVQSSGHNFGHSHTPATDSHSDKQANPLNRQGLLVGPEGFEPPTKGL